MIRIYAYKNCDTCRKALKWLDQHGIKHEVLAIRETPPTPSELKRAIRARNGNVRELFNTSGGDYRELGIKDRIGDMDEHEAIGLLSKNGNLVKRPLLLSEKTILVGFRAEEWQASLIA